MWCVAGEFVIWASFLTVLETSACRWGLVTFETRSDIEVVEELSHHISTPQFSAPPPSPYTMFDTLQPFGR